MAYTFFTTCSDLEKYERNDERTFDSRFMDGMIREWHDCSGVLCGCVN